MIKSTLAIIILVVAAGLFSPSLVLAATLEVGPGQTYATIGSAVVVAAPGDIILVPDGTYLENVVVDKAVTLLSQDYFVNGQNDGAVIDASGSLTEPGIYTTSPGVVIQGFTVVGSLGMDTEYYNRSGIYLRGVAGCEVANNNLGWEEVGFQNSVGLFVNDCDNCLFNANEVHDGIHGFVVQHSANNVFANNLCEGAMYNPSSSGKNSAGRPVAGGVYFYYLETLVFSGGRSMVLIK